MAPIPRSHNRQNRPYASRHPDIHAVPNLGRRCPISIPTSTNTSPNPLDFEEEKEDDWDDIPVDYIENDEIPVQNWWDGPARCWRVTPMYLNTLDQFQDKLPKAQYDSVWTQKHELRLQLDWKNHPLRELLLRARSSSFAGHALHQPAVTLEERCLWENICFCFGCLPSDIISTRHRMMVVPDISPGSPRTMPDIDSSASALHDILWSKSFCRNLNDILLHPIWEGQPDLLREAIKYTVSSTSEYGGSSDNRAMTSGEGAHTDDLDQLQLLYNAIDLVTEKRMNKYHGEKKKNRHRPVSNSFKASIHLVCAADIGLLANALDLVDHWENGPHPVPSNAWKGAVRRLAKPWKMMTDKLQDHGVEQLYLDVLRHQRRWALET